MAPRKAMAIGERIVLAMTCRQCRLLKSGSEFPRYSRSTRDRIQYQSRRCRACGWSRLDTSIGKNGIARADSEARRHSVDSIQEVYAHAT